MNYVDDVMGWSVEWMEGAVAGWMDPDITPPFRFVGQGFSGYLSWNALTISGAFARLMAGSQVLPDAG